MIRTPLSGTTRSSAAGERAVRGAATAAAKSPTGSRQSSGLAFESRTRTLNCPRHRAAVTSCQRSAAISERRRPARKASDDDRAILEAAPGGHARGLDAATGQPALPRDGQQQDSAPERERRGAAFGRVG